MLLERHGRPGISLPISLVESAGAKLDILEPAVDKPFLPSSLLSFAGDLLWLVRPAQSPQYHPLCLTSSGWSHAVSTPGNQSCCGDKFASIPFWHTAPIDFIMINRMMINFNGKQKGSSLQWEFCMEEEMWTSKTSPFHTKSISIAFSYQAMSMSGMFYSASCQEAMWIRFAFTDEAEPKLGPCVDVMSMWPGEGEIRETRSGICPRLGIGSSYSNFYDLAPPPDLMSVQRYPTVPSPQGTLSLEKTPPPHHLLLRSFMKAGVSSYTEFLSSFSLTYVPETRTRHENKLTGLLRCPSGGDEQHREAAGHQAGKVRVDLPIPNEAGTPSGTLFGVLLLVWEGADDAFSIVPTLGVDEEVYLSISMIRLWSVLVDAPRAQREMTPPSAQAGCHSSRLILAQKESRTGPDRLQGFFSHTLWSKGKSAYAYRLLLWSPEALPEESKLSLKNGSTLPLPSLSTELNHCCGNQFLHRADQLYTDLVRHSLPWGSFDTKVQGTYRTLPDAGAWITQKVKSSLLGSASQAARWRSSFKEKECSFILECWTMRKLQQQLQKKGKLENVILKHQPPLEAPDERALLSSSLAKTASNITGASAAADSQGTEQHEHMDWARQYSTRSAVLSSSLIYWKKLPPLPSLASQPHQVLASKPIPLSNLQHVSRIAAYATLYQWKLSNLTGKYSSKSRVSPGWEEQTQRSNARGSQNTPPMEALIYAHRDPIASDKQVASPDPMDSHYTLRKSQSPKGCHQLLVCVNPSGLLKAQLSQAFRVDAVQSPPETGLKAVTHDSPTLGGRLAPSESAGLKGPHSKQETNSFGNTVYLRC
ncbi:hypothetical protein GH733_007864 [Mirounga leonina]|nr:hypothetical protein GH733_007864 [Mirounga leonina]